MKNGLLFIAGILLALSLSGCMWTQVGYKTFSVGVTKHFADGHRIRADVVYELNGEYYVFAAEDVYSVSPGWWGIAIPFTGYCRYHDDPVEIPERFVQIKLTPEAAKYMLAHYSSEEEQKEIEEKFFPGEIGLESHLPDWGTPCDPQVSLSEANILPVQHYLSSPEPSMNMLTGDHDAVSGGVYLGWEKSAASWLLTPVALAGLAWDIPFTVAASTVVCTTAVIVLPITLIAKAVR